MTLLDFLHAHFSGLALLAVFALAILRGVHRRNTLATMVRERGWPPAHLDADGDFKSEDQP